MRDYSVSAPTPNSRTKPRRTLSFIFWPERIVEYEMTKHIVQRYESRVYILAQERKIERVGWFPDRDNIMTSYDRIAEHMFAINFSAFCQRHKVDEHPIETLIGRAEPDAANPKQSWYDELVRMPDFLAAVLANWHYDKNDKTTKVTGRQKYVDMLQGAVADNPYVIPLLLVETESGICVGKLRCSKDPIAQECQQAVS